MDGKMGINKRDIEEGRLMWATGKPYYAPMWGVGSTGTRYLETGMGLCLGPIYHHNHGKKEREREKEKSLSLPTPTSCHSDSDI